MSVNEMPIDPEVTEAETDAAVEAEPAAEPKKCKRASKAEVAKMQEELEAARKAADESKDQLLRVMAEYDNFRKRTAAEKAAIYDHAVKDTVGEILNVVDTMEMALAHKDCDAENLRKGVEMIGKILTDTLTKLKVEAIGTVGDAFDPNVHQAVSHIEDENLGENVLAQVYQKGYKIGDKIIRPATVVVAN